MNPLRTIRRHAGPVLGLVAVSVAWSLFNLREVLDQWSTAVPTRLDNRFQAWVLHWVQGAVMGEHPLYDANTFTPAPASLTFSDHLIGLAVAVLPLRWLGLGPAATFNTAIVLGVALDAVAGYVLGLVLTRRRAGGVVAAAVYALGPVPWLATMHLNLVWRPGLPLVVALVWVIADRAAEGRNPTAPWEMLPRDRTLLVLLGVVVAWQGLVSFFYAVFVLVVAALVLLVRRPDLRGRMTGLVVAVGAGTAVFVPSYVPYLQTRSRYPDFRFTLDEIAFLRAAPHIVEDGNIVWGGTLGRPLFGLDGFHAFPGATVIALAAVALLAARSWRRRHGPAVPFLALAVTVVGALGALGPGEGAWRDWTPYALAFRFVPGFSAIRASGRFVLMVLLGAAVLAALAVGAVLDRWDDRARVERAAGRLRTPPWVAGAVVALVPLLGVVVEGLADPRDVTEARTHPIDDLVAEQPPGGVLYLPIGFDGLGDFDVQEDVVFRSTAHDRPIVNGFAGYYPPSAFFLADVMTGLPDDEHALDCLAAYDIRYVVVTDRVALGPWAALRDPAEAAPLEEVATVDGEVLYRLPDRTATEADCPLPD